MTINSNTAVSTTTTSRNSKDLLNSVWGHIKAMGNRISLAYTLYNERRSMRDISDEMLSDMGITRAQLEAEMKRSAFDIPKNRK